VMDVSTRVLPEEAIAIPIRGGLVTEEVLPHVVVQADGLEPTIAEEAERFRADEPCGSRDHDRLHRISIDLRIPGETAGPSRRVQRMHEY